MIRFAIFALLFATTAHAEVLYIGDSHSAQPFGATLAQEISKMPPPFGPVDRYAVSGSSMPSWDHDEICAKTAPKCPYHSGYVTPDHPNGAADEPRGVPGFKKLVQKTDYSAFVIALGTNDAFNSSCKSLMTNNKPTDAGERYLKFIANIPKGRACIWVGPPSYTSGRIVQGCKGVAAYQSWVSELNALVEMSGCKFVPDPKEPKDPNKNYHFSAADGAAAAKIVANEIRALPSGRPQTQAPASQSGHAVQ